MNRGNNLDAMRPFIVMMLFRRDVMGSVMRLDRVLDDGWRGGVGDKRLAWFECTLSYFIG